jgi:hypothetical protein
MYQDNVAHCCVFLVSLKCLNDQGHHHLSYQLNINNIKVKSFGMLRSTIYIYHKASDTTSLRKFLNECHRGSDTVSLAQTDCDRQTGDLTLPNKRT